MRVLIVKLSSLGDVVQTLPVLDDILRLSPQARIDWIVEETFSDLLLSVPAIDRVLVCAQRRWRKHPFNPQVRQEYRSFRARLRERAYDVVIDCQGLMKSAWVARQARLTRSGFTATFGNRSELCSYEWPVRFMLDRSVPMPWQVHAVQRTRLLVAGALSFSDAQILLEPARYPFGPKRPVEQRRGVWLSHGTTRADNRWATSHWRDLGRLLLQTGESVFVPQGNEREAAWAEALVDELGPGAQVLPRLDLAQLCQRMAGARGVISVDSGLGHLAVGLDLPVVQVFSQDRIRRAGPVGRAYQQAVGGQSAPTVNEVWQAWLECRDAEPEPTTQSSG
jgi:heptosyltransferase-1